MLRQADNFVNYQALAAEFSVGDVVVPFGMFDSQAGRVTAVWPAIGMVDVEMSTGSRRFPVEDMQRMNADGSANPTRTNSNAGGAGSVSVPGGPVPSKVAQAFMEKKGLYWAEQGRRYRMNKSECGAQKPCCPKCGADFPLARAVYKRRDGLSEKLMGCKSCMFLIKDSDIINFNGPVEKVEIEVEGDEGLGKISAGRQSYQSYGTTTLERRQRDFVVYVRGDNRDAFRKAQRQHPGKKITDLLLVATDHLGVDEWVYNAQEA